MPPRTRKRKPSTDTIEPVDPPPKKPARAPRKTAPRQPRQSKNAASRVGNASKKKVDVREVKEQIQQLGDEVMGFIERELKSPPPPLDIKMISDELTPDLKPVLSWMTTAKGAFNEASTEEATHLKAIASMTELQSIINEYTKVNKHNHGVKKPSWMRWGKDAKELAELNQYAMSYVTQAINHSIMPGLHPSSITLPENRTDVEEIAWELVEESRPQKTEETWGMAAQEQVKAFTRILRLFPQEKAVMK